MKLIIGLGNPGEKYAGNRHNAGYMVVDKLTRTPELQIPRQVKILKTNTFMNDSGTFVKKLIGNWKRVTGSAVEIGNLVIVHDDLDLPLGGWKMQIGKGPKVHGGINDIEQKLGTKVFTRIRVGVDRRTSEDRTPGEDYVLQDFTKEERKILDNVVDEICKRLATISRNTN